MRNTFKTMMVGMWTPCPPVCTFLEIRFARWRRPYDRGEIRCGFALRSIRNTHGDQAQAPEVSTAGAGARARDITRVDATGTTGAQEGGGGAQGTDPHGSTRGTDPHMGPTHREDTQTAISKYRHSRA